MSFLAPSQAAPDRPAGLDLGQMDSHAEGPVVTWFRGFARLPLRWIAGPYARYIRNPDPSDWWFSNAVAVVASNPIDRWYAVLADDAVFYVGGELASGPNPWVDVAPHINGGLMGGVVDPFNGGMMRLHWGDRNSVDHRLLPAASRTPDGSSVADDYPIPQGMAILECWKLGHAFNAADRLPNYEVVVAATPKVPHQFVDAGLDVTLHAGGINPVTAVVDFMTDPIGGWGLPPDQFDIPYIVQTASELGVEFAISPYFTSRKKGDAQVASMLRYFDGFVRRRNGLWQIGRIPESSGNYGGPGGGLVTHITMHEMTRPPKLALTSAGENVATAVATCRDRAGWVFKDVTIAASSPAAARRGIGRKPKQHDLPFFVWVDSAKRWLRQWLRYAQEDRLTGSIYLRKERAVNPDGTRIGHGDVLWMTDPADGTSVLMRVDQRKELNGGEAQLRVTSERGSYPVSDAVAVTESPDLEFPPVAAIAHQRLFELPWGMHDEPYRTIAALADRPAADIASGAVWVASASTGPYGDEPAGAVSWAAHSVVGSIAAGVLTVQLSADILPWLRSRTDSERLDNQLIAIVGPSTGSWDMAAIEIMSIGDVTPAGGGEVAMNVLRGRLGTAELEVAAGWHAWIVERRKLSVISRGDFADGATVWAKLQPVNFAQAAELAGISAVSLVLSEVPRVAANLPQFSVFSWTRTSANPPTAPAGGTYASPAPTTVGWFLSQPEGSNPLWMSRRTYYSDSDPTAWSAPVRVSGTDGLPGASPVAYVIEPTASAIVRDGSSHEPASIGAAAYAISGATRTPVDLADLDLVVDFYLPDSMTQEMVWERQAALPAPMTSGTVRIRFQLFAPDGTTLLSEAYAPVIAAGSQGPSGESTRMVFGRFLEQPARPTETTSPPNASWSLDSEAAPGNSIHPLWVTVGTRPAGGSQWTWQLPFRFTPEKGDAGMSTAHLTIYRRSTAVLTAAPTGGSYNFDTLTLTEPTDWSDEIPAGTDPLYASNALASVPTSTGIDDELTWTTPRYIAGKGDTGDAGVSAATLTIYTRTPSPGTPASNLFGYTFANDTLVENATNLDGWGRVIPSGTGDLWASTAFVSTLYPNIEILPITWSAPRKVAENGQPGISTAQVFVYKRSTNPNLLETPDPGGSYSFDSKTLTAPTSPTGWSATVPTDATAGFVYISTATAAIIGQSGSDSILIWTQSRRLTDDMILPDGSIDASKIADNAIIAGKIAANAVVAENIVAGEINAGHLAVGSVTADAIAANAITAAKIAALAITAEKIAANAITAEKIAAGAITAAKIDVANLAALSTSTGHLVVDGSATSGTYSPGAAGWKINSDGSAEFNQLTLRAGIINPGHILLHDPSVLAYNPHFETVENGVPAGWSVHTETGTSIVHGTFGPANGKGLRFDRTGSGTYAQVGNQLIVPVLAGERLVARALVREGTWTLIITTLNGNKIWTQDDPYVWRTVEADWGYVESVFIIPDDVRYINITVRQSWGVGETQSGYLAGVSLMRQAVVLDEVTAAPALFPSQSFSTSLTITRPLVPSGRKLLYTTDGSEVTRNSPEWLSGVSLPVAVDTTLRARFVSIMSGSIGPETMASYTKAATPPAAPLPRPTASLTENRIATFVSALYGGAGTTTLHYSISSGASNSEASDYWSLSPAIVLGSGDFMTVWATGANGARSPDLIITHNPAYDGRYQL